MITPLQIRKATAADLQAIEHILQANNLMSDDIVHHLQHFFVAESEGTIVGTIGMEMYETTGLLRSAAVLPSYQNQGIGDKLVTSMDGYAREQGIEEIVLLTTNASKYFTQKGYMKINRNEIKGEVLTSNQFNGACPSTAISMRKKL